MNIQTIKRPWQRQSNHGKRYNPDPFYHSGQWKRIKTAFKLGTTKWQGKQVSNTLCLNCFKNGIITAGHTIDHIIRIEDGGSRTDHDNLQNLCARCHAQKSAREGNESRRK